MTTTSQNAAPAKANLMQVIQSTPSTQLANLPVLEERFITLYSKTQGVDLKVAEMTFQQEKYHFMKAISESEGLRQCEPLSLYGCFMDCAVQGLSFDPKKKLAYIIPGSVNVGTRDNKQYVKRASLEISPYGEMAIRIQLGQVKYADNPVIVYEGDVFEPYQDDGGKGVVYKLNTQHTNVIIAAFMRILRNDGTVDYHWMLKNDWERLSGYSEKKNFGKANALYTSNGGQIDPGFLAAKLIKHAFKSYPKIKVSDFSQLQKEEEKPELKPEDIYGFKPEAMPIPAQLPQPSMIVTPVDGASHDAAASAVQATAQQEMSNETFNVSDDNDGF